MTPPRNDHFARKLRLKCVSSLFVLYSIQSGVARVKWRVCIFRNKRTQSTLAGPLNGTVSCCIHKLSHKPLLFPGGWKRERYSKNCAQLLLLVTFHSIQRVLEYLNIRTAVISLILNVAIRAAVREVLNSQWWPFYWLGNCSARPVFELLHLWDALCLCKASQIRSVPNRSNIVTS